MKNALEALKLKAIILLATMLLRVIRLTISIRREGPNIDDWPVQPAGLLTFWHGHLLMASWAFLDAEKREKNNTLSALISRHSDGRIIAGVMQKMGIGSIAGSSSSGGKEAIYEMIKTLENGGHVAITPDGPKGPRHVAKVGVTRVAQLSGARIFPMTFAAERAWVFKSWDRMVLPKPFSKAIFLMGEPIEVNKDLSREEISRMTEKIAATLNELEDRAQKSLRPSGKNGSASPTDAF